MRASGASPLTGGTRHDQRHGGRGAARSCVLGDGGVARLATVGDRLAARVVDWALLCVAMVALLILVGLVVPDDWAGGLLVGLFWLGVVVISGCYEAVLVARWGQTLGKLAAGVAVRRVGDGAAPGSKCALLRLAIPPVAAAGPAVVALWASLGSPAESAGPRLALVGVLAGGVCYLSSLWDRHRRGWHDRLAGTVVVATPRAGRGGALSAAGLALALAALSGEIALAAAATRDPFYWLGGGFTLGQLVTEHLVIPTTAGCWAAAAVFCAVGYRRARTAHRSCGAADDADSDTTPTRPACGHTPTMITAAAGLCATAAGIAYLPHLLNVIT